MGINQNPDTKKYQIRLAKGSRYFSLGTLHTGYIYDSKEDAEADLLLYQWCKSRNRVPHKPMPGKHNWFESSPIGEAWDAIRLLLSPTKNGGSSTSSNLNVAHKRSTIQRDKEIEAANLEAARKAILKILAEEEAEQDSKRMKTMSRAIGGYKKTQSWEYMSVFVKRLQSMWTELAPGKDMELLYSMVSKLQGEVDFGNEQKLHDVVVHNFQDAFDKKDRRGIVQFGSMLLGADITKAKLSKLSARPINDRLYRDLNYHKDNFGAGAIMDYEETQTRNHVHRVTVVVKFIAFLKEKGVSTANARKIPGLSAPIPVTLRAESMRSLIIQFNKRCHAACEEEGGDPSAQMTSMRTADLIRVMGIVCPRMLKCLAALDGISENAGRENFVSMRKAVKTMINAFPMLVDQIESFSNLIDGAEAFAKKGFPSEDHFGSLEKPAEMTCACHCPYSAFGEKDLTAEAHPDTLPCGHVHSSVCVECAQLQTFQLTFEKLINEVDEHSDDAVDLPYVDSFIEQLRYQRELFIQYIGHKARLCHEDKRRAGLEKRCMEDPSLCIVTADYSMKWLPFKYREKMTDWFGKKGT
jgi:hypothetical protein